MGSGTNFI